MKETKLLLHTQESESGLLDIYHKAINESVELYMVSAYLTEWEISIPPNSNLKPEKFKFIFGKDFGLSRKKAISNALKWLPKNLKKCLLVSENIQGFHPKAVFWKKMIMNITL